MPDIRVLGPDCVYWLPGLRNSQARFIRISLFPPKNLKAVVPRLGRYISR